ncbi:MAG TPA: zinc-binding dehydrogenase [Baekduia sp.]|uniref:zinc-binding dehydrogenase n=1 Tax=Baekduia sp. TaxID=2600305 RepID=UPI002D764A0D|nr:zinc-binding dehydrogenase [Baekduia sp.]HET6509008.1 zinc-binding dehydrogenase [Baekduia sp.]
MYAFTSTGRPERPVVLSRVDDPRPAPGEVLVAVDGYSLNRGEVLRLLRRRRRGDRPGQDVAGRVLSPAGDRLQPGARVVGHVLAGSWAQRVCVPADQLAVLPDGVELTQAAALPMAGLTALRLVRAIGSRLVGGRVLITGAGGGVGHLFTELAAGVGARITAVTRRVPDRLLALGAERVIAAAQDAAGTYDVIVETVGGATLERAYQLVADDGLIVWMGQAGGEPAGLDFFSRVGAGVNPTIRRFSYWPDATATDADDLAALVRLVATGRLHPEIGVVEDWSATGEVIVRFLGGEVRGNAVLTVS